MSCHSSPLLRDTSEEPTDYWEEDFESCDEDEYISSQNLDQISNRFAVYCEERSTLLKPTLEQAKQALIDRLTRRFWSSFQKQAPPIDVMVSDEKVSSYGLNLKRSYEEVDCQSCTFQFNDARGPKRLRATPCVSECLETGSQFACPYRKHDPRKYCVPNWGPCTLTPLQTVARVKAHLYRHHRVHQCQRCKGAFDSQEDLDTHVEAIEACELKVDQPVDGVTSKIKERLQCRKKAYPGQTEADRWEEVYRILFPNEEVPSPYFEPIRDYHGTDIKPDDSREVANYEDYLRRELPKFFKNALESVVSHEMQPIEERVSRQMLSVLEEAQKLAFSKYRSMMGPAAVHSPISGSVKESTHLLTTNQSPIIQKESQNTSDGAHQPSNSPSPSDATYLLSFSDLDKAQPHEPEHPASDTSESVALLGEGQTTMTVTESNISTDSSSNSQPESEPITDLDLPLPDHEPFGNDPELSGNNAPPTCSDTAHNLAPFSDEWTFSPDKLDLGNFNWYPSWDITSAAKDT